MDEFFTGRIIFSLPEIYQLYIIGRHEASNWFKTETAIQTCGVKKVFLNILKNSQANFCAFNKIEKS